MENLVPMHAQQLFNQMPTGVVFHGSDGVIIYANDAAKELLGLSLEQLLGKTSFDPSWHAIHPNGDKFPGESHPAMISLKEGKPTNNVIMGIFHVKTNQYKWIQINSVPEFLPNENSPYRILVTFTDITELINAKNELKESKLQLTERLKELNCIYYINWLSENAELSISEYLQKVVDLVPPGFEYPEQTYAKINFGDEVYQSSNFTETNSKMMIDFHLNHSKKGFLTVFNPNDTPFLKEEFALLDNLKRTIEVHLNKRVVKQRLIESENRLKNLLNSQTSYVLRTNLQGKHTYWNHAFEQAFGWIYGEVGIENGNSLDSICVHHHARTFETVAKCIAMPGEIFKVEIDKPGKDGEVRSTLWEFICLTDENKKPFEIQCMGIDITEKTNFESELKKFRTISEQANYGTAISNVKGEMLYVNPKFAEIHGYQVEELIGKSIGVLHNNEQMQVVAPLLEKIKTEGGFEATEVGHCRKDGTVFPTLMSAKLITDENGNTSFLSATVIDITPNKAQEQIIKEQNEKLSAIISAMPDIIFVSDKDGNYLACYRSKTNSQIEDFQYLVGKNVRDAFNSEIANLHVQKIRYVLQTKQMVTYEFPRTTSHSTKYYEARVVPINESQVLRFVRDITNKKEKDLEILSLNQTLERRILERTKELEQSNLDLTYARVLAEEANRSKSEFLSRMSHELRTPMNAILGFAQLLQMGNLDETQNKSIGHILDSGKHLLNLINEVLDIARIEAGKVSVSVESVNVKRCFETVIDILSPLANARNISLKIDENIDAECVVKADQQRLKQILTNLINNGIKYNKSYGHVILSIEKLPTPKQACIRIKVIDNGVGISAKNLNKIFNPFERIDAEQTNTEGTGLGLAVVKQLAALMNGEVGVSSVYGKGSTFWIDLPVGDNHHVKLKKHKEIALENPNQDAQGRVLYIEDNLSNIELVKQVLVNSRKGIQLFTSTFGKKGIDMAIETQPDLILLDLNLPDCHGTEVLEILRTHTKTAEIPVVIISADAMAEQRIKLIEMGAKAYLSKPIEVISFLNTIDKYI